MAEHFWLFRSGSPTTPEEADAVGGPFTSLDEAREAAAAVDQDVDIFATPMMGGGARFVEHPKQGPETGA